MNTFKIMIIRAAIAIYLFLIISACSQLVYPVMNDNIALIPVITINGFPDGGSIEKNNLTSAATINADYGMGITISGSARSAGGIKEFTITITRKSQVLYDATTTSTIDINGKVPDLLAIVGTNNSGGVGNIPMKFILDEVTEVRVLARNYAPLGTQLFTLTYIPVAASQRGKDLQKTISMQKDLTLNIFSAKFPDFAANGTLRALNGGPQDVYLLKPTMGIPFNCSNPSSTIRLPALGNLFPADYVTLFGALNAPLPINLKACPLGPAANSDHVDVTITYRLN